MVVNLPPERLRAALDALEAHASHPETGALHDPIYLLSQGADPVLAERLARHLERSDHPAAPEIRAILGLAPAPPDTLAAVLEEAGLAPGPDPVGEVRRHLRRSAEVRAILDAKVAQVQAQEESARRLANAMTAVAALLAVVGLLGWAAALGLWEIPWGASPSAEEEADP